MILPIFLKHVTVRYDRRLLTIEARGCSRSYAICRVVQYRRAGVRKTPNTRNFIVNDIRDSLAHSWLR